MRRLLVLIAMFSFVGPAAARDDYPYTEADAVLLQDCLEALHAAIEDPADGAPISGTECVGVAADACMAEPDGASTYGMMSCNLREVSFWEEQAAFYVDMLRDSLTEEQFAALTTAQDAWLAYRDAQCNFLYEFWIDGTIRNVIASSCLLDETGNRAGFLMTTLIEGHDLS